MNAKVGCRTRITLILFTFFVTGVPLATEFSMFSAVVLGQTAVLAQPDPPGPVIVMSSTYVAKFDGHSLVDGTATLQIGPGLRAHESLPLHPLSLSVTKSAKGGAAADGKWWAAADENGEIKFKWVLSPVRERSDWVEFAIRLPVSPQTKLTLSLPADWRPVVLHAVMTSEETQEGRRLWSVDLGANNQFRLRLLRQMATSQRPMFQIRTEIRVGVGRVDLTSRFKIEGELFSERIQGRADSGLTLLDAFVDGHACEIATEEIDGGSRSFSLLLPREVSNPQSVRITAIGPVPRTAIWVPPRITLVDMDWSSESLTVVSAASISLAPAGRPLPAHVRTQTTVDGGLEMDFRLPRPSTRIRLRVDQRKPELLIDAITSVRFSEDQIQGRVDAEIRSLWGEVFELQLPKPRAWIIDKVESSPAGLLESGGGAWEVVNDRLVITLSRPITPQRGMRLIVDGSRALFRNNRAVTGAQLRLLRFPRVSHMRHRVALSAVAPRRLRLLDDVHLDLIESVISETDRKRLLFSTADIFVRDGPGFDSTLVMTESSPDEVDAEIRLRVDVDEQKIVEMYECRVVPSTRPLQTITFELTTRREEPIEWLVDGKPVKAQRLIDDERGAATEKWSVEVDQSDVKPMLILGRRESYFRDDVVAIALASVRQANSRGFVSVFSSDAIDFEYTGVTRIPVVPIGEEDRQHKGEFEYRAATPLRLAIRRVESASQESLAWALRNRLISEFSPDGRVLHTADFWIQSNGRREITMTLPTAVVPLELRIDGEPVPLVVRNRTRVICPLPARYSTTLVRLVYRSVHEPLQFMTEYQPQFLGTDFACPTPHWFVVLPRNWRIWSGRSAADDRAPGRLPAMWPGVDRERRAELERLVAASLKDFFEASPGGNWKDCFVAIDQSLHQQLGGRFRIDRLGLAEVGVGAAAVSAPFDGGLSRWLQKQNLSLVLADGNSLLITSRLGMASRREAEAWGGFFEASGAIDGLAGSEGGVLASRWNDSPPPSLPLPLPTISRQRIVFDMETRSNVEQLVVYDSAQVRHLGWALLMIVTGVSAWLLRHRSPLILLSACLILAAACTVMPAELAPLSAAVVFGVGLGGMLARLGSNVVVTQARWPRPIVGLLAIVLAGTASATGQETSVPSDPQDLTAADATRVAPSADTLATATRPLRPTWFIRNATYRWYGDASPPRLTAEYEIQRVGRVTVVALPFKQDEVTPIRVTERLISLAQTTLSNNAPRSIGFQWRRGGGLLLYLTKAGTSRIRLEFLVASKDQREFSCAIPRVAQSQFLDMSKDRRYQLLGVSPGSGDAKIQIGPRNEIRLVYRSPMASELEIRAVSYMRIRSESVTLQSRFTIDPQGQMVESISFEVPPQLRLVASRVDEEIGVLEGGVDGSGVYWLRLKEPNQNPFDIELTFHMRDRLGTGRIVLPHLIWQTGIFRRHLLALDYSDEIEIDVDSSQWDVIDPGEVETLWQPADVVVRQAFAVDGSSEPFAMTAQSALPSHSIDDELVISVGARNVALRYNASVLPKGRPISLHQLQTPLGLTVEQLTIVEENVEYIARYVQAGNGVLTVFLPNPTDSPHRLFLTGSLPISRTPQAHDLRRIRFLGAKSVQSRILVYRRTDVASLELEVPDGWDVPAEWDPLPAELDWSWELGRQEYAFSRVTEASNGPERPILLRMFPQNTRANAVVVTRVEQNREGWSAICDLVVERPIGNSGRTDVVQLEIPEQWQAPFQVEPPAKVEIRHNAQGQRTLTLIPPLPLEGDFHYRITGQWTEFERRFIVPDIVPSDMSIQDRIIVLPTLVDQQTRWNVTNLVPASIPEELDITFDNDEPVRIYSVPRGETFEASLERIRSPGGYPLVRLADVRVFVEASGLFHGTLVMDVEPAGELQILALGVPERVKIDVVQIGNSLSIPTPQQGRVSLRLHSLELPQRIEIRFHGTWDDNNYRLAVPKVVGTPVAETLWTVTGRRRLQNLRHRYPDAVVTATDQQMERLLAIHMSLEISRDRLAEVETAHAQRWYRRWFTRLTNVYGELIGARPFASDLRRGQIATVVEAQQPLTLLFGADDLWEKHFGNSLQSPGEANLLPVETASSTTTPPEPIWRFAFSGSRASLTLAPAVSTTSLLNNRWLVAVSLLAFGLTVLLTRRSLESQLSGRFPSWPSLVIAIVGLLAAVALQPLALAAPLIVAALWLARPTRWAGIPWRFRRSE
jgi:hypothetical protein